MNPTFSPLTMQHCITGSVRHVYEFNGYPISEALLLGLGSGLGFVYWHMKGTAPFFGGRANTGRSDEEGLERTAARRTGVNIEVHTTASSRKAETALLDLLTAGQPVMLYTDMGFLPYLGLPEGYHFGGHTIVAVSYDESTKTVMVADRDGALHPVSLETLAQARGSKFKPFPPEHKWFTFDFSDKRAPYPAEIWDAIREVAYGMLNPPIANLGVKGIRTAAARIRQWPNVLTDEELRFTAMNCTFFIDTTGGTGGGIFRYMYSRFLQEAAVIVNDNRLTAIGEQLREIGDCWQGVIPHLEQAAKNANSAPALHDAAAHMEQIAEQEQSLWEAISRLNV